LLRVQEKYLTGRLERMQRILKDAGVVADAMAAAAAAAAGGPAAAASLSAGVLDSPEAWGVGPDGAAPALPVFVKALDERLINALQETVVNVNDIFLQVGRGAGAGRGRVGRRRCSQGRVRAC
jgi:hypothetical protein